MGYFNRVLGTVLNEFQVPTKFIRVTDHALERFRKRVPGGREVDKTDIVQFVGDSEMCNKRNYRLLRDAYRRRNLKWRGGDTVFKLYGLGGDRYVVFAMSMTRSAQDVSDVRAGSPVLLVVTCWVADNLFPN